MWISTRDNRGGLMPMDELGDETLTCLAIVAGLQGLSLREWIEKALRVALAREDAKATATEPPSLASDSRWPMTVRGDKPRRCATSGMDSLCETNSFVARWVAPERLARPLPFCLPDGMDFSLSP